MFASMTSPNVFGDFDRLRRELDGFGATLAEVQHGDGVDATLRVPESRAAALVARINDAGQGRVLWRNAEPD